MGREGALSFWMVRVDGFRRKVRLPPGSGLDVVGGDDVVGSPGLDPRLSGEGRRDAVEDSMEDGPGTREF